MLYTIFTDGASRGNPGPGGWGAVIVYRDRVKELGGYEEHTTNNRMELTAALRAVQELSSIISDGSDSSSDVLGDDARIKIYTDSSYLINGITKWVRGWKANGWQTKEKTDVLNKDIWQSLAKATNDLPIEWVHVGGHVGIKGNERCDEIATMMADDKSADLFDGTISAYPIKNISDTSFDQSMVEAKKSSSSRSRSAAYSYVSMVNGKIETHKTWADCEKRVKGVRGTKYKKSLSRDDEAKIIKEFLRIS